MKVTKVQSGHRNVTLHVRDMLTRPIMLEPIETGVKELKLTSLVWVIQEKMGLYLYWNKSNDLILPMESRNSLRFDTGIAAPSEWNGVLYLSTFGDIDTGYDGRNIKQRAFFLALDFDR
jgi:hypothetical protein